MKDINKENAPRLERMNPKLMLVGYINEFNNKFQTVSDYTFEEASWKQLFILNCITLFDKAPTIKEVSDFLGSSHQNTKQLLIKLQNSGYLSLEKDEEDKRKTRVLLKRKAKKLVSENSKTCDDYLERLFEGVNRKDIEATARLFMKLDENLNAEMAEQSSAKTYLQEAP